jgi:lysozyme
MPTPLVIDLSHHNVIPESLEPAKAAGIVGLIHKMSEGTGYTDDKVQARYTLALRAGMAWGLYHFIRPGRIIAQADFFLAQAEALGVLDRSTLLALDWEDAGVSAQDALLFLDHVQDRSGRAPVLYSGHVCKEDPDDELGAFRLWLAQYASSCTLPTFAERWWLWQYTDKGAIAGVTPPTDLNAYDGSPAQLLAEWSGGDVIPSPVPVVTVIISTPPGVRVEVQVVEDDDDAGSDPATVA